MTFGRISNLGLLTLSLLFLGTVTAIAQTVPSAEDDPLRHGHALLIGNYRYVDRWNHLDDIAVELRQLKAGLDPHFDTVELKENLTRDQTFYQLRQFLDLYGNDSNARLFIYYSGHGYSEPDPIRDRQRGFITGIDTPLIVPGNAASYEAARTKAISMDSIKSLVADINARHVLFIFDSCFAGTIFGGRDPGEPAPSYLSSDEIAQLLRKPVRDFITAGTADERVPPHSPIPKLLLDALRGGPDGADYTRSGVVTGKEIGIYLWNRTRNQPGLKITPQEGKLLDPDQVFAEGEFLFRIIGSRVAVAEKPVPTPPESGASASAPSAGPPGVKMPKSLAPSEAQPRTAALTAPTTSELKPGPPPAPTPRASPLTTASVDPHEMARQLQTALQRVGCYGGGIDGIWDSRSADAVKRFNQHAHMNLSADTPSPELLEAIHTNTGRVCPLTCQRGQAPSSDHCVALHHPRPPTQREAPPSYAIPSASAAVSPPPAPPRGVAAPTSGTDCFVFNDRRVCQ